jgi:hypothetical protein
MRALSSTQGGVEVFGLGDRTAPQDQQRDLFMPRKIVTTDRSAGPEAQVKVAGMSSHKLTQRQIRCIEQLPEDHKVVNTSHGEPTVRRPNGQLLRLQRNGHVAAITRVKRVQSYLQLHE